MSLNDSINSVIGLVEEARLERQREASGTSSGEVYELTRVPEAERVSLSPEAQKLKGVILDALSNYGLASFCRGYGFVQLFPVYKDEEGNTAWMSLGAEEQSSRQLALYVGVWKSGMPSPVKVISKEHILGGWYDNALERLVQPSGILDLNVAQRANCTYRRALTPGLFEDALIEGIRAYAERV